MPCQAGGGNKHLEIISRHMLLKVKVGAPSDTSFWWRGPINSDENEKEIVGVPIWNQVLTSCGNIRSEELRL
jgi:hypothetical protein